MHSVAWKTKLKEIVTKIKNKTIKKQKKKKKKNT